MVNETNEPSIVASYATHEAADKAVRALAQAGLDMHRLSVIGKGFYLEEHAVGFYTSDDRMKVWGATGAFWGSLGGLLIGSAFFLLPLTGPVVIMGPLVGWLVAAMEGAALGGTAGVFGAALAGLGIPEDSVVRYEAELKAGRFLLLARGAPEIIAHARFVLETTEPAALADHSGHPQLPPAQDTTWEDRGAVRMGS